MAIQHLVALPNRAVLTVRGLPVRLIFCKVC